MPELHDKDLDTLFRAAGHHRAGDDLAARIMARVAVTPIHRPVPTPPLIGRWGWIIIGVLLAMPVVAVLLAPSSGGVPLPTVFSSIGEWLSTVRLPNGQWPLWTLGGSFVAMLLVALDHYLGRGQGVHDRT